MRFQVLVAASLLALPLFALAPPTNAQAGFVEGFESFNFPNLPSSPYYTFATSGSGSIRVSTASPLVGAKSLVMTQPSTAGFQLSQSVCTNGVDFHLRQDVLSTGAQGMVGFSNVAPAAGPFSNSGTNSYAHMTFGNGATPALTTRNGATTETSSAITNVVPLQTATNRHFGFVCIQSGSNVIVRLTDYTNSQTFEKTSTNGFAQTPLWFVVQTQGGGDVRLDDVNFGGLTLAAPTLGAAATLPLTGVTGFSVDPTGTAAIARTDGGANVKAIGAQTLSVVTTNPTGCASRMDGVAALASFLSYVSCDVPTDVTDLHVRSNTLGDPVYPTGCDEECQKDFNINTGFDPADADDIGEITSLQMYAFDYAARTQPGCVIDCAYVPIVWAFSTSTGKLGLYGDLNINNAPDHFDWDLVTYDPTASPSVAQICRALDPANGREYLYATTGNGVTAGYRTKVALTVNNGGTTNEGIVVDLEEPAVFVGSGAFASANAIACDDELLFLSALGKVWLINRETGNALFPAITATAPTRGVAMSEKIAQGPAAGHRFAAYATASSITVLNLTSFAPVATMAVPSGTFLSLHMDSQAQSVWVATTTQIVRFDVWTQTTIKPVASTATPAVPGVSGPSSGLPGVDVDAAALASGVSATVLNWFVGLMFVAALAGGFYALKPALGMVGAGLGFVMAVVFGYFQEWVLFLAFLAAAAAVARMFWGSK